jgi:hypothetical protein
MFKVGKFRMQDHQKVSLSNRRKSHDRRQVELGPPQGWRDRRVGVERRLPVVGEDAMSEIEWFKLLASYRSNRKVADAVS